MRVETSVGFYDYEPEPEASAKEIAAFEILCRDKDFIREHVSFVLEGRGDVGYRKPWFSIDFVCCVIDERVGNRLARMVLFKRPDISDEEMFTWAEENSVKRGYCIQPFRNDVFHEDPEDDLWRPEEDLYEAADDDYMEVNVRNRTYGGFAATRLDLLKRIADDVQDDLYISIAGHHCPTVTAAKQTSKGTFMKHNINLYFDTKEEGEGEEVTPNIYHFHRDSCSITEIPA